jgi:hypothetical protein
MTTLDEIANNYLEANSVNWRLGINLHNDLIALNPELARACLKRSIELKPTLVRRLNLKDDELNYIAQKHLLIALNDSLNIGTYFKVPTINSNEELDLQIFSILSNEINRHSKVNKIKKQDKVFGFGSCFAVNFVNYLNRLGIDSHSSIISEDVNSPINNLLLLKWVFQNEESQLINDLKQLNPDIDRLILFKHFKESDHIVLTLGSSFYLTKSCENSEITLKPTRNSKYSFQTVGSIKESIAELIKLIQGVNSKVNIFITVSPIPLRGVLDLRDPVTANIASKAALRAAIEELIVEKKLSFTYLPIYDSIMGLSPYMNTPTFGTDDGESRHLNGFVINSIMKQMSQLIVEI